MFRDVIFKQDFGGLDDVEFKLDIGGCRELEDKTNAGPRVILQRLLDGSWKVDEVGETIRLGLIGGGMEAIKAQKLVKKYVYELPNWTETATLASYIMAYFLYGKGDEEQGKKAGGVKTAKTSPKAKSDTPTSTVSAS